MHHVGDPQRKYGYGHVKKLTAVGAKLIAALHGSNRCFQHSPAGICELLTLTEPWLLAYYAGTGNFLHFTAAVGDHPVSIQQLAGRCAMIADGDGVGEGISLFFTGRFTLQIVHLHRHLDGLLQILIGQCATPASPLLSILGCIA